MTVLLGGVLLPTAALVVECATRICRDSFFDPLPTVAHTLLWTLVPCSNLALLCGLRRPKFLTGSANAIAIGVAALYCLFFLPLIPMSLLGILAFGVGLCGLAPFSGISAALLLRRKFLSPGSRLSLKQGLAIALAAFVLADLQRTVTRVAVRVATSESNAHRYQALEVLRYVGDRSLLLRMCYQSGPDATDPLALLTYICAPGPDVETYRDLLYRTSGRAFDSEPPPPPPEDLFSFHRNVKPWTVGDPYGNWFGSPDGSGLTLQESRFEGRVDADALTTNLDWTMNFTDSSNKERPLFDLHRQEAWARLALPDGALVTGLTLWVNGQPVNGTTRGRAEARQGDGNRSESTPCAVVSLSGPGEVFLQCEPGSLPLKLRLSLACPLRLVTFDRAQMHLPHFLECNFHTSRHQVNLAQPLSMSDAELAGPGGQLSFSRSPNTRQVVASDENGSVVQTLETSEAVAPSRLLVVVDGSAGMANVTKDLLAALDGLPAPLPVTLLQASDQVREWTTQSDDRLGLRRILGQWRWVAGQDDVAALLEAERLAGTGQARTTRIVWIHGAQPESFEEPAKVRAQFEDFKTPIYDLMYQPGPVSLYAVLDGLDCLCSVTRQGFIKEDLQAAMEGRQTCPVRRRGAPSARRAGSSALLSLWRNDEVMRLATRGSTRARAVELAARYGLVTPVSSTVVRHAPKEDFDRNALRTRPSAPVFHPPWYSVPEVDPHSAAVPFAFVAFMLLLAEGRLCTHGEVGRRARALRRPYS